MIIGIIIGICIMSVLSTISVFALDNGKDKVAAIFSGPAMWLCIIVYYVVKKICTIVHGYKYQTLLVCPDGQIRRINSSKADIMLNCSELEYNFPKFQDLNVKIDLWKHKHLTHIYGEVIGSIRYTPKDVWRNYTPICAEEYRYAKDHQCV